MEPVGRIAGVRSGIDPVVAAQALPRVEREEPREEPEPRRRPPRRPPPPPPPEDGHAHIDVQA